jgi:hypothetical protein
MAQECMDIFERDKLPVVATVEQVCLLDGVLHWPLPHNPLLGLFHGGDRARQNAKDFGRRDGSAPGQPRSNVRSKVKKHVGSYLIMSATVTLTRSASSHCISNTEKVSPTRTVGGCTSMRDCHGRRSTP